MLRPDASGPLPRWAWLVGVLLALVPAIVLSWRGITWLDDGCACGGGGMPDWLGWLVIALALPFYAAAAALLVRRP